MTEQPRTCDDHRDLAARLVAGDIATTELQEVKDHLAACAACRTEFEQLRADDRDLSALADGHAERITALRRRATAALPDQPGQADVPHPGWITQAWHWGVSTVAGRTAALAAVAAILVFMVVFFQGPGGRYDAWAQVVEAIGEAVSGQFRIRDLDQGDLDAVQVYAPHGTSHETYENGRLVESLYVDFDRAEMVYISPEARCALRATIGEELQREYRAHRPGEMFSFMQAYPYEDLGRRRIDGKSAVGLRVRKARFMAERLENAEIELWVDPETKLPLRLDVTGDVSGGTRHRPGRKHVRFDDFHWNVPAGAAAFRPPIPRGYDIVGPVHLRQDETHFILGLRLYAETVGGSYPASLSYESLKAELWSHLDVDRDGFLRLLPRLFQIRMSSEFYGELVDNQLDVVYFGYDVRPSDEDRVLIRWKLDDDHYRVIYGDLRAETVSADELLELEAQ